MIADAVKRYNRNAKSRYGRIQHRLIHTGQHYEHRMSGVFFDELSLPKPNHHLGVGSGPQGEQTGAMLTRIEKVLLTEKPDVVMIYGDTNSTVAGALAAAKLHIKVAHLESGLRSFNRRMPEEINRVASDHLSDFLFCPTDTAVENLRCEGITRNVFKTGDVMLDSVIAYREKARKRKSVWERLKHSRALRPIAKLMKNSERLKVIEPVSYLDMLALEIHARLVLTDSGGVQKEAFFAAVPCLTLREETEWLETQAGGWNQVVGTDPDRIRMAVAEEWQRNRVGRNEQPDWKSFGEGRAANETVTALMRALE